MHCVFLFLVFVFSCGCLWFFRGPLICLIIFHLNLYLCGSFLLCLSTFVLFLFCPFLHCPFLPFLISTGKDCPQGTYSTSAKNAKDSDCTNCGTGTYSTTLAADQKSQCLTCRVSKYSPNVGADQESACQNCVLGFEQSLQGMSYCLPCTPGSYGKADENGYAICEKCPNNYYSNAINETSCETCPTGRISDIGSVSCSLCPAGWKVDGLGCTSCMPGT